MQTWWSFDGVWITLRVSEAGHRSPFQSHLDNLGPRLLGGTAVLSSACGSFACFVNNLICKPDVTRFWSNWCLGHPQPTACCPGQKQRYWTWGGGGEPVCWRPYGYTQIHPLASPINMHITRNSLIKSAQSVFPVSRSIFTDNKAVIYFQASRDTLAHTFYDGVHIPAAQTFPVQKGQQQCRYYCSDYVFVKNKIQYGCFYVTPLFSWRDHILLPFLWICTV